MKKIWVMIIAMFFQVIFIEKICAQGIDTEYLNEESVSLKKTSWFQWKPYVSVGGNYGQKLNIVHDNKMELKSYGYNAKIGIQISRNIAVEIEHADLNNFIKEYDYTGGWLSNVKMGLGLKTNVLNLKIGYPFLIKKQIVIPYAVIGFGKATVNNSLIITGTSDSVTEIHNFNHKSKNNSCSKIGLGLEMPIYKNRLLISGEVSKWKINRKGGRIDNESMYVEFKDIKLSLVNTILNLKYIF